MTGEIMMLLAFVLSGAVLWTLRAAFPLGPASALVLVRPTGLALVLLWAPISVAAGLFIGWFGPRGLSSLLLALFEVQAGVPNGAMLHALLGAIVVLSIVVHGATATPLASLYGRHVVTEGVPLAEERESAFVGLFEDDPREIAPISVEELHALLDGARPPLVLDVRSRAQYDADDGQIPGSIRVLSD